MVMRVNITISPVNLSDLYVINESVPSDRVQRLSDFQDSGSVLEGRVVGIDGTDVIRIISSGYVEQVTTLNALDQNPNIVLVSSNDAENLSDGTNTYPIADKTARELINSLDDCAFNGVYVDQTYDGTSSNAQSGTAVAGALADKANTDLSNLNATGQAIVDKITDYPKRYFVKGLIANSANGNFLGHGQANVVLYASGLAEIHFEFQTTAAGSNSSNFKWGVNRDMLHNLNDNIPVITPQAYGSIQFYTSGGSINTSLEGYAGSISGVSQFWVPSRIYTTLGELGSWPETQMTVGTRVVGVVYGTFTV